MNGLPTVAEKEWHLDVVNFAKSSTWLRDIYQNYCIDPYSFQLDHIVGAKAKRKINGVTTKVGEWAVMPIPIELHDLTSNNPLNRTLRPGAFRKTIGNEKLIWLGFIDAMKSDGYELPFSEDIINSIVYK
jgi:hypothetical protein